MLVSEWDGKLPQRAIVLRGGSSGDVVEVAPCGEDWAPDTTFGDALSVTSNLDVRDGEKVVLNDFRGEICICAGE